MDFFQSQESLTTIQWVLRAIVAFFFLLFAVKIMGQRSIAQLRLLDFIMAISIGNIIAHPLSDEELGMRGSLVTMTVLVVLYLVGVFFDLKWIRIRHFFDPAPIPLIREGKILSDNLNKARIPIDYLLAELRKEKVDEVKKVALALLEADGSVASFLYPQYQAATKTDLHVAPSAFSLPLIVIREGKADLRELKKAGQDESWLRLQLEEKYQIEVKQILLATIDSKGKLDVYPY